MDFERRESRKGIAYLHWLNGITTFSFAILFSSLSLYLTKRAGLTQLDSNGIVGFFFASNFILHFIAGCISDKLLSTRLLFTFSTVIQSIGIMVLNFMDSHIYLGLSLFLIGCGLGSTCINCLLTQQFQTNENELREKAFFHNYSAMNIGFLCGFLMSGFIDISDRYEHLFEISSFINLIVVFCVFKSWPYLGENKVNVRAEIHSGSMGLFFILLIIPVLLVGFYYSWLANSLILLAGLIGLFYIPILGHSIHRRTIQRKMYSFLFLTGSAIVFWMLYFVGPMGVSQFLKYNVNININAYYIPPQWLMNLNSIFVIVGSPLMIILFKRLRQNQNTLSISKQFMCSLIFIALSFLTLAVGIITSNSQGFTGIAWIVIHYLLQAIGELLIAPVGYAMIGTLVPEKSQGVMMGIWMMAPGISATLSNYFSNVMTQSESINPLISNEHYMNAFTQLCCYALLGALFLWVCSKMIERSIQNTSVEAIEGIA